ncbi:MAG TPA: DUF4375 domain-containing protein [Pyrinomonadaceae bacterium]|jgi:hypothetical protein
MSIRNEERVVRYVERFQSAVACDGFEGFFHADDGDHAQATLNALLVIGAVDAAALLRRAMWVFDGGEPPPRRAARREELRRVGEAGRSLLRRLDESFRRGSDELTRALTEYSQSLEEPCDVA